MAPRKDCSIDSIGERLRIAREGMGLSTRSAAVQLKTHGVSISHGTLANYERGLTHPSEDVLIALSKLYNRSVEWFRGSGYVLEGLRYRALKSVTVRDKASYSHEAGIWLDLYVYLEFLLGEPLKASRSLSASDRSIGGKELAAKVRRLCDLGTHPLPSAIRLLEDFGVRVVQHRTAARIDAFAARFGGARVVVLNAALSPDRMRLTALHELAHHLYEDCLTGPSLSHDQIERRAFQFASHVLIPAEVLKEAMTHKSMVCLVDYKERYGISLAALVYRARREGLVTQRQYEKIWRQFAVLGFRKNEPGSVAPDRPVRLGALIDVAVAKGKTTFPEIAAYLGADESSVRNRVLAAIGGTISGVEGPTAPNILKFRTYSEGHDLV